MCLPVGALLILQPLLVGDALEDELFTPLPTFNATPSEARWGGGAGPGPGSMALAQRRSPHSGGGAGEQAKPKKVHAS